MWKETSVAKRRCGPGIYWRYWESHENFSHESHGPRFELVTSRIQIKGAKASANLLSNMSSTKLPLLRHSTLFY
jgi:hypothetical protein